MDKSDIVQHAYHVSHMFEDDGQFPNNQKLPLLIYKGALFLHPFEEPSAIAAIFEKNHWSNTWTNGIYDYHHYHSITHEVLGIFCGRAEVQLGGPQGVCVELIRGDVIIIPAGVAHKRLSASDDFSCVGAYPDGKEYDVNDGKTEERLKAIANIGAVPIPDQDPVYGNEGGLMESWI